MRRLLKSSSFIRMAGSRWARAAARIAVVATLVAPPSLAQSQVDDSALLVNEAIWLQTAFTQDYLRYLSIVVASTAGNAPQRPGEPPPAVAVYDDGTHYFGNGSDSTSTRSTATGNQFWDSDSTSIPSTNPFGNSDSTSIPSTNPFGRSATRVTRARAGRRA